MPFVLDVSVASAWAFEDEDHPAAALALEHIRRDGAIAPSLWWFEVRNTLVVNERRQRIAHSVTASFLRELSTLPVSLDYSLDETTVLLLARRHRLTVYDAAYLELAQRGHLPLATLDRVLSDAARAENVPLIG